jgi:hypothetical protein
MNFILMIVLFWWFNWGRTQYYLNKNAKTPTIRLDFATLDEKYKKWVSILSPLSILMMPFLTIGSAWLFYLTRFNVGNTSELLFDFRPSLGSWFFWGIVFMFAYLMPAIDLLIKLILGKANGREYIAYLSMQQRSNTRGFFRSLEMPALIVLIIGCVFMFDYTIQIDKTELRFNTFSSFRQEQHYTFDQISNVFYYPEIKNNEGETQTVPHYVVIMKNGFEWNSSSSLDIDTTVFPFLSDKSGVKIDTIGKK